jgi:hypothetical protein
MAPPLTIKQELGDAPLDEVTWMQQTCRAQGFEWQEWQDKVALHMKRVKGSRPHYVETRRMAYFNNKPVSCRHEPCLACLLALV